MVALIRLLLISLSLPAFAQDAYPSRPVRLIVSFTPGGGADLTARVVGQRMGEAMCTSVQMEAVISQAEIGASGVRRVVERDLTEQELAALRTAADAVRAKQADVASL